ncbi:hypothetical protein CJ010_15995 [Azoarcus sp. DD4]|uniref:hypothetical protein n=1 Tax=Azoarcus sp. DD4 TaxID=2027405 RepID=UPI00112E245B|nr:hypothetical protein [Azoarcus sp. DD4]QDF97924.1 hypothetical protein CJ010_15995 [Azoarcus sp. DD4]
MKRMLKILLLLVAGMLAAALSGCAVNRATATVDPSADLAAMKTMHVQRLEEDGYNVNVLIADKLRGMGYEVSTGTEKRTDVDALVTYWDKWMWDITMYLLELTITIRDPRTDYPLATGTSLHTSLTRKSAQGMVDEVIGNIFKGGEKE